MSNTKIEKQSEESNGAERRVVTVTQTEFNARVNTEHYPDFIDCAFDNLSFDSCEHKLCRMTFDYCTFCASDPELIYRLMSFKCATFHNCTFTGLKFCDVDFTRAEFLNCTFTNCVFNGCTFLGTRLYNSDFYSGRIADSVFKCGVISCCDFSEITVHHLTTMFFEMSIENTDGLDDVPMACPSDGAFIGWKKVRVGYYHYTDHLRNLFGALPGNYIVKLQIPAKAKRSSATTNKCRCSEAKVLGIYDEKGKKKLNFTHVFNSNAAGLDYIVGETVYPDKFDDNRWDECSNGIHFFINKSDAVNYNL